MIYKDETYIKQRRYMLVYQAGLANVYCVRAFNLSDYGRDANLIYQGDFRSAECISFGLGMAGHIVRYAHCNMAGSIVNQTWSDDMDSAPFRESMHPQQYN